jgi:oligoribonuclease
MDLEMTGLDVERDAIVEIAALATSATTLEPLDAGLTVVVAPPPEALAGMSDFVRQMHQRSGLLAEIGTAGVPLEEAGRRVLEYIKGHVPEPKTVPLCGNSIGMDRRFLARYLPDLEEHLHYRSIDVSSIKELCRRWYPRTYYGQPGKGLAHRALADIRESIRELEFYRRTVFVPQPGPDVDAAKAIAAEVSAAYPI